MQRSQANDLAYELVDRMRIYRSEALAGAYDSVTLCDGSERNGADARTCQLDDADAFADDKAIEVDLEGWWHAVVEADLPNWYAGIERTGDTFSVSVQWDDARAEPDPPTHPPRSIPA